MIDCCAALVHMHHHEWLHGDLASRNFLLSEYQCPTDDSKKRRKWSVVAVLFCHDVVVCMRRRVVLNDFGLSRKAVEHLAEGSDTNRIGGKVSFFR